MGYEPKKFEKGDILTALDLNNMGDGIAEAKALAMEGAAGAANMEKGTGVSATQQLPDKVADGFDFTDKNANATALDSTLTGTIPYGATGNFSNAFGGKCAAQGKRSHAEGTTTIAKGNYSHAEGDNSVSLGADSHAEGYATTAAGTGSHTEGTNTIAQGAYSHAEGIRAKTTADGGHAEGCDTTAGEHAHAEGNNTTASGAYSHAEGCNTVATGVGSHAEGYATAAQGTYSHAQGQTCRAEGVASNAAGRYIQANEEAQTVVGQYNDYNFTKTGFHSLFQVGCGSDEATRKNGINVSEGGEIIIYWNNAYYSLHAILNLISNTHGGAAFFDAAKITQ